MNDLVELRESCTKRLGSLLQLTSIAILTEDKLDLITEIQKALAQSKGFVIVVSTGDLVGQSPNVSPPECVVDVVVEVAETPAINRSETGAKIPAIEAATIVAKALHCYQWCEQFVLTFERMRQSVENKSIVLYTLTFKTSVMLDADIQ